MKILYIAGYSRMVLFNKLIPDALRINGCEVIEFDWNSVYSFNKAIKIFSSVKVKQEINIRIIGAVKKHNPDIVFILKGEPLTYDTLKEIKEINNPVMINWFGDDPWEFPVFSGPASKYYDFFFTYDPWSVALYKNAGHKNAWHLPYGYVPAAADRADLSSSDIKKYSCDISFIGSYYPKREEILKELMKKYNLRIWGRGWKNTSCSSVYQGHALYGYEMLKAMKCSKILLNIHKGFEEGVENSGEGLNLRVAEGAACASFQMSNFQADIPYRFVPDKEIVLFSDRQEMYQKIEFYLSNDEARKMIAQNGRNRLEKDHLLEIRMKEMLEIISENN